MSYTKKHVKIDLWPEKEKEKYPKNRETLKLITIQTLLLFCSICFIILILLLPFTYPSQTTKFASTLPRTCDQNFTVYVYDLPKEFNIGLLQNCRHLNIYTDMCPHVAYNGLGQPLRRGGNRGTWFATHQFIAEMIFHARVLNHPCRTFEPDNAEIFYVPFYGGLYSSSVFREQNLTKRDELAVRLVDYVSGQRWWKRSNGRDHFLAIGRTAWDFMRSPNDQGSADFGANMLMQMPRVKNMSVLTVERQPWKGDNQFGLPYPSYFHPYTSAEMVTWQDKMKRVERPHLFSFVGGPRKGLEKAAVRDELIRQCAGSSHCELLKCQSGGSRCHDPMIVLGVMARSRFCLQAPGDSFTRRSTFDAMLAGCIPVFFSPHTMYTQYMWYLPDDRRSYSVFMDDKNSTQIEHELSRISESDVVKMRETVINLVPRLTYSHPNATNYDLPDAVDVALEALAKQAKDKVVYSL